MSWDMWHVYGYGFASDESKLSEDKLVEFAKNHLDSLRNAKYSNLEALRDYLNDLDAGADCSEETIREITDTNTAAEIISTAMSQETGIRFETTGLTDYGEEAVIFGPGYPWNFTEKEQGLTEEDLDNIVKKYTKELFGKPQKSEYIDYEFSG